MCYGRAGTLYINVYVSRGGLEGLRWGLEREVMISFFGMAYRRLHAKRSKERKDRKERKMG